MTTTMLTPLRRALQVGAAREAVVCGDDHFTYTEMWERCRRLIGALRALGLEPGDRVGVLGPNCHRYLELYLAVPTAGFVVVPLNARHTEAELRYAIEDSGAKVFFSARDDLQIDDLVEHVFDLGDGYEALLAAATPGDPSTSTTEDDLAGLFYTGGTTGASKGVMLTHRNTVSNGIHFAMAWPFTADTRWAVIAPLFHAAGTIAVLSTIWRAGCHVVLPSFDPDTALDLIERNGVTATCVVPTMLAAMTEAQIVRPRDVSSLTHVLHGGSPIASATLGRASKAFENATFMEVYGATEVAPIATLFPREEDSLDTERVRSCGQPAVGVEVRVWDTEGLEVPVGTVGEIVMQGPNVMAGYWNKEAQTAAVLVDGWYRSGDLGYQDDEGFVFLVDRAKDMIVSGGENVYSTEVEEALAKHPAVLEVAVFGIPDPHWGEAVHAVVVNREPVESDELIAHCRELIAGYKVPKVIDVRDEPLPKSGAGKVLNRELRKPYWEEADVMVSGA